MCDDSSKVGISIRLEMPQAGMAPKPRPNIEDQIRACIQRIDDGTGTEVDFLTLRKVKAALLKKGKDHPRVKNLLQMIEPTIRKFGYYF